MRMTSTRVTADRVFPVAGVFGDVVVSRRGALTVGWEVGWPAMFSCVEDEYDAMVHALAMGLRLLPVGSVLHRQDMYTYEEYSGSGASGRFLEGAYDAHFRGRRYLRHRSYLFLTMAPRGLVEKAGTASGLFGIAGTVSVPSPADLAAFRGKCAEFLKVASSGGAVTFRALGEDDYLGSGDEPGIIQRYMMLGRGGAVMSDIAFTPDSVSVYDRVMQAYVVGESDALPGVVATVDRVQALSAPSAGGVWLSSAARIGTMLDCEHVVNQVIVVPHQDELLRSLEKEKNRMMAGMKSVDNRANGEQIAQFLEDQYRSAMFLVKTHMNVMAWGREEERQELAGTVSSALRSMLGTATYNNYNTPVLYYAGIPTNACEIGRENLMTMELYSALCLAPYETFEPGVPGGAVRLCDRVRHVPVEVDMQLAAQAAGLISNYNIFVLGSSGSGKSFFTNAMVRNLRSAGQAVFIIDVGDSYEGQARVEYEESGGRDGVYLSWDDDHPLTFDAFAGAEDWLDAAGGLRFDEEGGNFFMTLVKTIYVPDPKAPYGGWTSERSTVLQTTVQDYLAWCRAAGEKPLFDGYYRWFDREVLPRMVFVSEWEKTRPDALDEASADRIRALKEDDYRAHAYWCGENLRVTPDIFDARAFDLSLKEYSLSGARARLLNDPSPRDVFASDFTVVEVDRLSQDDMKYYSVCILCIMHALDVKMRRDTGKFKTFIIEEAWKAISNETMAPYLRGLWKTARKFNTSACVVTQELADIVDNPVIKTSIVDNSDVKVLLDQKGHANDFGLLQKALSLTDKDRALVLSINRGDAAGARYKEAYVNLGGRKSMVLAVEVSREEALAFESNKDLKAPLLERAAACGSLVEAIREAAGRGRDEVALREAAGMSAARIRDLMARLGEMADGKEAAERRMAELEEERRRREPEDGPEEERKEE